MTGQGDDVMADIERDVWLEMVADYLSKERRFTTDATVPDGLSTVDGLRRAAADLRGAVDALEAIADERRTSLRWRSSTSGSAPNSEKPNVRTVAADALERLRGR